MFKEDRIEKVMKSLDCSREDAIDVLKHDEIIDKGGRTEYDLPIEQEKLAKKMANAGTRKTPTTYNFNKRERKENTTKSGIISALKDFLSVSELKCENVNITNKERQIAFSVGENDYELTLVQKRKKK